MQIKNLTSRKLKLRRTGKKETFLKPGTGDYDVSLKDEKEVLRLRVLRDAKFISIDGELPEPKNGDEDVRNTEATIEKTGTDGNTDTVKGSVSRQKANKSR